MQRVLALFSLFGVGLLCTQPATSQVEGSAPFSVAGTSAEAVDRFLAQLRDAIARGERAKAADMLQYPLQAWDGERSRKIKTRKQLLRRFDAVFDSSLLATIGNARSATAFANWQGVMFDDGRIWLRPTDAADTLLIVTINAPVPMDHGAPAQDGLPKPEAPLDVRSRTMPMYLTRFSYTPETWARLAKHPEDRRDAARVYIESVGGQLHGFWYAFGEYDGYCLWAAPDNVAMAAVSLAISGGGALSKFETTVLLTVEETLEALRRVETIRYRQPGN